MTQHESQTRVCCAVWLERVLQQPLTRTPGLYTVCKTAAMDEEQLGLQESDFKLVASLEAMNDHRHADK